MNWLDTSLQVMLWSSLAAIVYAYIAYPVIIFLCARGFGRQSIPPHLAEEDLPTVSVLIAAYNEEAVIQDRIRNALALNYPAGKLEIVIASDGSSDDTNAIVQRFATRGVQLLDYPKRRGKASVLNSSVPAMQGEIVILSDANTDFDSSAVRNLVQWFTNPAIGAACGRLVLTDPVSGRNVDSLYWRYETFIKKSEGKLGALLGANGAIYAIRRKLYTAIPPETLIDDFVIPLLAKIRTRCKIVYDPNAIAREETPPDVGSEFHRRSRIGAGGFQSIGFLWRLLNPLRGWIAFTFFSHKILRWIGPFLLIAILFFSALLCSIPAYRLILASQLAFYLSSFLASKLPPRFKLLRPLRLATMFTGMNCALLVGFWRWIRGSQKAAWKRTVRSAELEEAIR